MQRKTIVLIGIVVIIGALLWFGKSFFGAPEIRNLDSQGTTIVAFGDSLIEGVGATDGNDFVTLLSRRIGMPIINLGKSGDTTANGLERINSVLSLNPRLVILLLGGNDFLKRIPAEDTMSNLGKIITAIQGRGASVLLLGVRGGILRDSYNEQYRAVAKEYKTGFVPNVLDDLIGNSTYMSDGIHPNDAGYAKIAEKVEPVLRSMLRK